MSESPVNGLSSSDLIAAAKSIAPEIVANRDRIESDRQLPPDLAARMAEKQLFGLYVPRELGGPETDPITAFHVVEEIAQADGSTGWCVFNGTAVSSAVVRISRKAARGDFRRPALRAGFRLRPRRWNGQDYRRRLYRIGPLELPQRH